MPVRLDAFSMDAHDPGALADFWAGVLDRERLTEPGDVPAVAAEGPAGFRLRFRPTDAPKTVPNRFHPDLTSGSQEEMAETVERAIRLGGRRLDIGQGPDADHEVMADPEGNELCVLPPGNRFLEGCGFLGALAGEGLRATGVFWSEALGWPLVWDQDGETAVQAPEGGTKVTFGGPPVAPNAGWSRVHFDVVADDLEAEVERLVGLGARRVDIGRGDVPWVVLADPDGTELCVLPPA